MPRTNNSELKARLEELARFGSPVDLSVAAVDVASQKVGIEQVGSVDLSRIVELPDHSLACITEVSVINRTSRAIDIIDVDLRAPWDESPFSLLKPAQVAFREGRKTGWEPSYSFPGLSMRWDYDQVLNHSLVELDSLPSRRQLQGWLLATGMPAQLKHGQQYELLLTIVAADNAEYSATLHLLSERRPVRKLAKRRSIFVHPTEPNLAVPDPGEGPVEGAAKEPSK